MAKRKLNEIKNLLWFCIFFFFNFAAIYFLSFSLKKTAFSAKRTSNKSLRGQTKNAHCRGKHYSKGWLTCFALQELDVSCVENTAKRPQHNKSY